jgi:ribosomal protein RSM22 (predicted rRNA methylase)
VGDGVISSFLPAKLRAALDAKLQGLSRSEIAARASKISKNYRDGGSSATILSASDALAYALARMPATYAAVTASLNALCEIRPDFAPKTLLDVGAGPGTASYAAAEAFSSLMTITLLDANPVLRALALELAQDGARFNASNYQMGDASALLAKTEAADLVIASYLIGELGQVERRELAYGLWAKTRNALVIIEPGTPAGYERILAARAQLIATGAHVAVPCPHDATCPLSAPDWCHFAQRLPRLRAHKQVKDAEVPFEDEKFSYAVMTRAPTSHHPARVLAPPHLSKVEVTAKLCTAGGLVHARIPRRDKTAYAAARRWRWGNAVVEKG